MILGVLESCEYANTSEAVLEAPREWLRRPTLPADEA